MSDDSAMRGFILRRVDMMHAVALEVHEQITPLATDPFSQTVHGMFTRAVLWAGSLRKLDDIRGDFQAHNAGARAMFESFVDVVLLVKGKLPYEMQVAWERGMLLKATRRTLEIGTPNAENLQGIAALYTQGDAEVAELGAWVAKEGPEIEKLCTKFWNGTRVPNRWTGRNLIDDAREVDKLGDFHALMQLRDNYDHLNWCTHGSGLTFERSLGVSFIPDASQMALHLATESLACSTAIVLEHFGQQSDVWTRRIEMARIALTEEERSAFALKYGKKPEGANES
jgi:hypothetical protein